MSKKMPAILIFSSIILAITFAGCQEDLPQQHLTMSWGIPEEVRGIEGIPRDPEGTEVEVVDEDTLRVEWHPEESYLLPISATSEVEMKGVRYRGSGIPVQLELEWLDPWEEQWYDLEEIPEEMVRAEIEEENGLFSIDFGPPEGAGFEEDTIRVIWFRITPTEPDEFYFNIYGYLPEGEEGDLAHGRVSNILTLQAEVTER